MVASVWMIAGIILLTMFTAQVSARLVTQELDRGNHLFGKEVNNLYGNSVLRNLTRKIFATVELLTL